LRYATAVHALPSTEEGITTAWRAWDKARQTALAGLDNAMSADTFDEVRPEVNRPG
jgi:hypothetical protein